LLGEAAMDDGERQRRRKAGLKGAQTKGRERMREAGLKASETKGEEGLRRAGLMAAWTRKNGKNDAENPYTKQNYKG
jgi:hypothetical protein